MKDDTRDDLVRRGADPSRGVTAAPRRESSGDGASPNAVADGGQARGGGARALPRLRDRFRYKLSSAKGVIVEYDPRPYLEALSGMDSFGFAALGDAALAAKAGALRDRVRGGGSLERATAETFALLAQACERRLGIRPYNGQLAAAAAMCKGRLVQMGTGEGKTLAAAFAAAYGALPGLGFHVLTANDYLAARDAAWMGPLYEALGLSVAFIRDGMLPADRKAAYAADVTYLTAKEAGFDLLRDQLAPSPGGQVQREFHSALFDEADFILIDEARIPLVVAGPEPGDGIDIGRVDRAVSELRPGRDFEEDREGRKISLTLQGILRLQELLGVPGPHEEGGGLYFARAYAALFARCLLRAGFDYIVKGERVLPVDAFTGRAASRKTWPWGVQAALEAKEGIEIRPEGRVLGTITIRHLAALYPRLAGMSATALPAAEEFSDAYGLGILILPPRLPCARRDERDRVFATRKAKLSALVDEIAASKAVGRPILVGTQSVAESEELGALLSSRGIGNETLNATNDEREAEIIAAAGARGAVTISTNMAGRGVDIRLGGAAGDETTRAEVEALGGLYVIGTGRHESRRVDDQLRGRSGRQGESGSSRFFVSLEDSLFLRYGVLDFLPRALRERLRSQATEPGRQEAVGACIEDRDLDAELDSAQRIIEARNHAYRKTLHKYSRLLEIDRRAVRELRDSALRGILPDVIASSLELAALSRARGAAAAERRDAIAGGAAADVARAEGGGAVDRGAAARAEAAAAYVDRLDEAWAEHLALAEDLKEGIDFARFAARDPGTEYLRRTGDAFEEALIRVEDSTLGDIAILAKMDASEVSRREDLRASAWTYLQEEDGAPAFALSTLMAGNPVAAALAGLPLFLAEGAITLARSLASSLIRFLGGRRD